MAMVGLSQLDSRFHCHSALALRTFACTAALPVASTSRKYSLRSMPAENASPAPVSTSTRQRSSPSRWSSTRTISSLSAGFIALRLSGRFNVTQAMPSSNSTSTVSPHGSRISTPYIRVPDIDIIEEPSAGGSARRIRAPTGRSPSGDPQRSVLPNGRPRAMVDL